MEDTQSDLEPHLPIDIGVLAQEVKEIAIGQILGDHAEGRRADSFQSNQIGMFDTTK